MKRKGSWRTRFGFYWIAVGSAFGLGNIWRFPYVVGENGGGAFVLLYILLAIVIGSSFVIAELMLGKIQKKSVLQATIEISKSSKKPWYLAGRMCVWITTIVTAYYAVISGWVLHFLIQFLVALFAGEEVFSGSWRFLMENGWLQWALGSVHILIVMAVVGRGAQQGIEKWLNFVMPIFAICVLGLLYQSLSLPSTPQALRFLFYPDFTKLQMSSLLNALGHVFFTLSVGLGIMVTLGSHLREEDHAPTAGLRVALVDTITSLIAALVVFPLAFQASPAAITDSTLLFEILPPYFISQPGGIVFGFIFFVSLYVAALNVSLSLFESLVSNKVDAAVGKLDRTSAVWRVGIVILVIALVPALSSNILHNVRYAGRGVLENMDGIFINWILPGIAMFLIWGIRSSYSRKDLQKNFLSSETLESVVLLNPWLFILKWVAPFLILLGYALRIYDRL